MTDKIKLKPCPFCGGKAHVGSPYENTAWVYCGNCGADTAIHKGEQQAADAWNRRAERTGKWIDCIPKDGQVYFTPGGNGIYKCSECGHQEGPNSIPVFWKYCPECGARMED